MLKNFELDGGLFVLGEVDHPVILFCSSARRVSLLKSFKLFLLLLSRFKKYSFCLFRDHSLNLSKIRVAQSPSQPNFSPFPFVFKLSKCRWPVAVARLETVSPLSLLFLSRGWSKSVAGFLGLGFRKCACFSRTLS